MVGMKLPVDVCVDIESLSLSSRAVVTQIGVAAFNRERAFDPQRVGLKSTFQVLNGRHVDKDTVEWWKSQPGGGAAAFYREDTRDVYDAIEWLRAYIKRHDARYVWANGTRFDIVNIEGLCEDCGISYPWSDLGFRAVLDSRTMRRFFKLENPPDNPQPHNPAFDALRDAEYLRQIPFVWQEWHD